MKCTHNYDCRRALGRVGARCSRGGLYSNSFSPTRPGPGGGWWLWAGGPRLGVTQLPLRARAAYSLGSPETWISQPMPSSHSNYPLGNTVLFVKPTFTSSVMLQVRVQCIRWRSPFQESTFPSHLNLIILIGCT